MVLYSLPMKRIESLAQEKYGGYQSCFLGLQTVDARFMSIDYSTSLTFNSQSTKVVSG